MKPIPHTSRPVLALGAALVIALTGCGSDEPTEPMVDTTTEGASETTGDDPAETTGADASETGDDAGGSTDADPKAAGDVAGAKRGLANYLSANKPSSPTESTQLPGCPVLEIEALEHALAEVGYPEATMGGWGTEIEWSEYQDISPELMGVVCGGDSDGDPHGSDSGTASGMVAIDLTGHTDFATFVEVMGLGAGSTPSNDSVVSCPDPGFCMALWHEDGLVIGTVLMAEGADEERAGALLEATVPEALITLAAN